MVMIRRPRLALLASGAALLGAVSLTGCGNDDAAPAGTATPRGSASSSASSAPATSDSAASDRALVTAAKLVLDEVPGSTLTSIEADRRGWEVQVATDDGTESKAVVDAAGTEILSGPTEDDDREDRADNARLVAGATVDYAVASRIIARNVPGAITELNLDDYHGLVVWEADDDSRPKVSVRVNAGDGRVIVHATASSDDD